MTKLRKRRGNNWRVTVKQAVSLFLLRGILGIGMNGLTWIRIQMRPEQTEEGTRKTASFQLLPNLDLMIFMKWYIRNIQNTMQVHTQGQMRGFMLPLDHSHYQCWEWMSYWLSVEFFFPPSVCVCVFTSALTRLLLVLLLSTHHFLQGQVSYPFSASNPPSLIFFIIKKYSCMTEKHRKQILPKTMKSILRSQLPVFTFMLKHALPLPKKVSIMQFNASLFLLLMFSSLTSLYNTCLYNHNFKGHRIFHLWMHKITCQKFKV